MNTQSYAATMGRWCSWTTYQRRQPPNLLKQQLKLSSLIIPEYYAAHTAIWSGEYNEYLRDTATVDSKHTAGLISLHFPEKPLAAVDLGSQDTTAACQVASACEAQDGYISFWAKSVPAAALVINVTLLGPSTTSSSGIGYNIATDEEVKDMLDRVYNN